MKKEELRIGNFVQVNSEAKTVTAVGFEAITSNTNFPYEYHKYNDVEPIKLNQSLLKDFGFKKDVGKNDLPIMRLGGLYVYLDDFTFTYLGNILAGEGYVHQLQNIYFVINGVDLPIRASARNDG